MIFVNTEQSPLVNAPDSYFGCSEIELVSLASSMQVDNEQKCARIPSILKRLEQTADHLTVSNSDVGNA